MEKDIIRLRNMRFYAYHGLFPEEARLGQRFEVRRGLNWGLQRSRTRR